MTRPPPSARPPQPLRRVLPLVLATLAVALLASTLWPSGQPEAQPAAPPPAAAPTAAMPSGPVPVAVPALLDAAQWAQLQAALADDPQRDAELARILGLLDYQRAVQRFAAMRTAGAEAATVLALAGRLDAELTQRLARGELGGPEAVRLKAALLEVLEPDPALRAPALADWRQARLRENPPVVDPRDAALQHAQQALVARWRQQAPPGSPPDELIAALEALRQRTYANAPP
jgi:hypothetical protein